MEMHQMLAENAGKAFHNTLQEMYKQASDGEIQRLAIIQLLLLLNMQRLLAL